MGAFEIVERPVQAANNGQAPRTKIKVLVLDDEPIARLGIATLLRDRADMEILDGTDDPQADSGTPDVVLLDCAASSAIASVVKRFPSSKVVLFTLQQSEEHIYRAIQAGVHGYLVKTAPLDTILDCIRVLAGGGRWLSEGVKEVLMRRMSAPELTRRERDVLLAMSQGKSNKQIANMLGLTTGTVKVHMSHIMDKLKVHGRTEALAIANTRGLLTCLRDGAQVPSLVSRTSHS